MAEDQPGGPVFNVQLDELKIAFDGPAMAANRFISVPNQSGFRIAFLEQAHEELPPFFRAAVFLNYWDVVALRDLLSEQIRRASEASVPAEGGDGATKAE